MKWVTDEFTGKRFGKYEVLCRLAVGGMAEIFLGFAREGSFIAQPVVLKRILADQREDPVALQMLLDEARVTATLAHPNVAQVLDLETADDEVLLVIEFIQGANVEEIVEAYTTRGEAVPLGFALAVVREAAQGLAHAHQHKDQSGKASPVVHRDVTPRNVMVDFEGISRMLDFGIARAMGAQRRTVAGMVRGTTSYMSPEQAIGKDLDPRSDIFSLGVIFHELLTGQRLFYKGNPALEMAAVYEGEIPLPSKVNRRVPKALDAVVMKALERQREKRYQTALELIRDISLAANSTTWSKERCAEMVRERFEERRTDMLRLLARIPVRELKGAAAPPPYPEGRTVMVARPTQAPPASPSYDEPGADEPRTQVAPRPQAQAQVTAPGVEPHTDAARPAMNTGLSAESLFSDLSETGDRTKVISKPKPASSKNRLLPVNDPGTDPQRPQAARRAASGGGSRVGLIVAAIAALAVGGVGGALVIKQLQPARPAFGRLSLAADRTATVFLGGQSLGQTPLSDLVLPAGRLSLELRESNGKKHQLDVTVDGAEPQKLDVALDSLRALP
jgi:serine/threonine protein kinase